MKGYTYYIMCLCAAVLTMTSCVADVEPFAKGWLYVTAPTKDSTTMTRAGENIDYLISVTRGNVTYLPPRPYSQLAGTAIAIPAGKGYTLLAESCNKSAAESLPTHYGQPRYAGTNTFDIEANTSTSVAVTCAMANAAFQVVEDPSFYYTSYEVKATVGSRTLSFTNEEQMGYFNVNEDEDEDNTTTLAYTVTAVSSEGRTGTGSGTVTLRAKTLSRLHLKAEELGRINLGITYDDRFTPIVTQLIITPEDTE